jgi:hypothetical protein
MLIRLSEKRHGGYDDERANLDLAGESSPRADQAAVVRWLVSNGVSEEVAHRAADNPPRKRLLIDLAATLLGREYRTVEDGVAIAGWMRESDIDPDIVGIVTMVMGP